ncbi:hypothetical protein [Ekhidna sp.]|jgi:hypothetical protein|uniref:hypothetical protein n=1 Tax=Ekhidna sp. TaxID=2608089 RepID=UPI0032EBEBB2
MIWFFKSTNSELFENKLVLKARLDAEYLSKSKIEIGNDFVDIIFKDHPYVGYLLHAKKRPNGSIRGYVHHFNPIFLSLLILLLLMIVFSDLVFDFILALENSTLFAYFFSVIFFSGILREFFRAYRLVKTLRLN